MGSSTMDSHPLPSQYDCCSDDRVCHLLWSQKMTENVLIDEKFIPHDNCFAQVIKRLLDWICASAGVIANNARIKRKGLNTNFILYLVS